MANAKENLLRQLTDAGMSAIAPKLVDLSRESFRIRTSPSSDKELPIAASKLGGLPDLPAGTPWPDDGKAPLSFVAQINLSDVPTPSILPRNGVLSFFYDTEQRSWGFDPKDRNSFRVFYFSAPVTLERVNSSNDTFSTRAFSFLPFLSIPDPSAKVIQALLPDLKNDEVYSEFFEDFWRDGPDHQLLGWPAIVQNEMELECQLVTHGLYCGDLSGYKDPRRKELEQNAQDWILLFQVDSDDDAKMMWGDVGRLYFWIRRHDLEQRDFARAWCILQCY